MSQSRPVGPYAPLRRAGDWIVTSGQLGLAPGPDGTPALVDGGTAAQLRQALANMDALLATEGLGPNDVVKTTLFLVDMNDFAVANEEWVAYFSDQRPTRSAVAVAALPLGALAEVEAWAYSPTAEPDVD